MKTKRKSIYMIQAARSETWVRTFASEVRELKRAGHKLTLDRREITSSTDCVFITIEID